MVPEILRSSLIFPFTSAFNGVLFPLCFSPDLSQTHSEDFPGTHNRARWMHEDHDSGKMLWQKKKLVALKANSFAGQNTLDQMQETEEQMMDCGPGSRITTTPSPGSLGDAFSLALTFLLPLTMTTEETSGAPYLSNDALVCHQWS